MIMTDLDRTWLQLINEAHGSGLSDFVWCKEHGYSINTFYYHLNRLRKLACSPDGHSSPGPGTMTDRQDVVKVSLIEDEPASHSEAGCIGLSLPAAAFPRHTPDAVCIAKIRSGKVTVDLMSGADDVSILGIVRALQSC